MNQTFSRLTTRRVSSAIATTIAAIVLSSSLATGAYAAQRDGDRDGMRGDKSGYSMMQGTRGLSRLHDSLKLDATQEALWKSAEQASKDERIAMRDRFQKQRDEIKTMLEQPGADLHAIANRMDDAQAERQQLRLANRARWLNVYDSLNPEQKEQARAYIMNLMTRMGHRGNHHHGR